MSPMILWLLFVAAAALTAVAEPAHAQVPQRLQKGDTFQFTVDAGKVVRPANHRVMGISFFQLWNYLPIYDRTSGEWILRDSATKAIQSLHLPFSRLYWMDQSGPGRPSWDLHGSIDRAARALPALRNPRRGLRAGTRTAAACPRNELGEVGQRSALCAVQGVQVPLLGDLQ